MYVTTSELHEEQLRAFYFWQRCPATDKVRAAMNLRKLNEGAANQAREVLDECQANLDYAVEQGDDDELAAARREVETAQDLLRAIKKVTRNYLALASERN